MRTFFSKKKTQKRERCNGCLAAEINDNRMHMDLTRSTTPRYAAMVKRVFDRARDPQRMWISRDYHKMRCGQKHFCYTSNFLWKRMLFKKKEKENERRSKKSFFFFDKKIFEKN